MLIASLLLNAVLLAGGARRAWRRWAAARKRLKSWTRSRVRLLTYQLSSQLPIDKKLVVLESYRGESFSGNPLYIAREIAARKAGYRCVICVNHPSKKRLLPNGCTQVKRMSVRYHIALARAKYLVNNVNYPDFVQKRPGTVHIQTMHGTPLKLMGSDIVRTENKAHDIDLLGLFVRSKRWDVLVSPNRYTSEIFSRVFRFRGPILESGYPRNDILVQRGHDPKFRALVRSRLGIPAGLKVILYAPTWRDYDAKDAKKTLKNLHLDLEAMAAALTGKYVLLVRLHHLMRSGLDLQNLQGFVYDVSDYEDGQELCCLSDLLVTDYSSLMFDYAILNRPILFFVPDYDLYMSTRGTYFQLRENAPGPIVETTEDLLVAIRDLDDSAYSHQEAMDTFRQRFCSFENGTASRQVVDTYVIASGGAP